ncbi:MAG: DUF2066 domain-containing protein [Coxiellaceae bacterium]|nr:MAG: DUF2066 domain-containing protein [Coxiellaceae bacterium]
MAQNSERIKNAANYVVSYSYYTTPGPDNKNQLVLQVKFDADGINQLLQNAQVPFAGKQHRLTLVWVTIPSQQNTIILGANVDNPVVGNLQSSAKNHNVDILLPLMDLQDMNDVSVADVQNLNPSGAIAAAQRYGANSVLLGSFTPRGQQWDSNWLLEMDGTVQHWQLTGDSPAQIIDRLMTNLSNIISSQSQVLSAGGNKQVVRLRITNVNGIDDYAAVTNYLRTLSPVNDVAVVNVNPQDITVDVTTTGGQNALIQALSVSQQLVAEQTSPAPTEQTSNVDATPTYRWSPPSTAVNKVPTTAAPTSAMPPAQASQ